MPEIQSFTINAKLPGLNDYVNRERRNRFLASKLKREAEELIRLYILSAGLTDVTGPSEFRFLWQEGDRRRDKDNVAFAKKFIFDRLQRTGILPNDNNRFVTGFSDAFEYTPGKWRVHVTIIPTKEK